MRNCPASVLVIATHITSKTNPPQIVLNMRFGFPTDDSQWEEIYKRFKQKPKAVIRREVSLKCVEGVLLLSRCFKASRTPLCY